MPQMKRHTLVIPIIPFKKIQLVLRIGGNTGIWSRFSLNIFWDWGNTPDTIFWMSWWVYSGIKVDYRGDMPHLWYKLASNRYIHVHTNVSTYSVCIQIDPNICLF